MFQVVSTYSLSNFIVNVYIMKSPFQHFYKNGLIFDVSIQINYLFTVTVH